MDCLASPPTTMGIENSLEEHVLDTPSVRRPRYLNLATPSSASSMSYKRLLTPGTPQPERCDLNLITGDVGAVFFDFDGTLTASPGDRAQRCRKQVELRERAPLLAPRLKALREAGMVLAIISKKQRGHNYRRLRICRLEGSLRWTCHRKGSRSGGQGRLYRGHVLQRLLTSYRNASTGSSCG
jgi:hypothetical protein